MRCPLQIPAERGPDDIFGDVCKVLDSIWIMNQKGKAAHEERIHSENTGKAMTDAVQITKKSQISVVLSSRTGAGELLLAE